MTGLVKVFRRVLVLRRITAADVAARPAQTQVKPRVADLQAVFTAITAGRHILNLINMSALAIHGPHHKLRRILLHCACRTNPAFRSPGASGVFGGGLDFRINDRVDFRAIQIDFRPTRLGGESQAELPYWNWRRFLDKSGQRNQSKYKPNLTKRLGSGFLVLSQQQNNRLPIG